MKRTPLKRKTPLARGKPLPRGKRMRRRSKELTAAMKLYNVEKERFLEMHRWCEACAPISIRLGVYQLIANRAQDVHHMKGRHGKMLREQLWWAPVCRRCHDYIEANKKWAREVRLILYK